MLLFIINLLSDKHLLSIFMCQILFLTQETGTFSDLILLVNYFVKVSMPSEGVWVVFPFSFSYDKFELTL